MRSIGLIFKKFFVLVGYFSGIPLLVRVKIPILRDTPKKYSIRDDFFSKDQNFLIKDKSKSIIGKLNSKNIF